VQLKIKGELQACRYQQYLLILEEQSGGKMATLHKPNKSIIILLLPMLITVFILGWSMCANSDRKRLEKMQRKLPKKDTVIFLSIVFEKRQEIRA
jgi:hypothetical protein